MEKSQIELSKIAKSLVKDILNQRIKVDCWSCKINGVSAGKATEDCDIAIDVLDRIPEGIERSFTVQQNPYGNTPNMFRLKFTVKELSLHELSLRYEDINDRLVRLTPDLSLREPHRQIAFEAYKSSYEAELDELKGKFMECLGLKPTIPQDSDTPNAKAWKSLMEIVNNSFITH